MKTIEEVKSMIENKESFILYLTATWCMPCKAFGPKFEDFASKHTSTNFVKCDVSEKEGIDFAKSIGTKSVPSIHSVVRGEVGEPMGANVFTLEIARDAIENSEVKLDGFE